MVEASGQRKHCILATVVAVAALCIVIPIALTLAGNTHVNDTIDPASQSAMDETSNTVDRGGIATTSSPATPTTPLAEFTSKPNAGLPNNLRTVRPNGAPSIAPISLSSQEPTRKMTGSNEPIISYLPTGDATAMPSGFSTGEPIDHLATQEPNTPNLASNAPSSSTTNDATSSPIVTNKAPAAEEPTLLSTEVSAAEEFECSFYEPSVEGGYDRMCFGSNPCCEIVRATDSDFCRHLYDIVFPEDLIREACSSCCPGKTIGDPIPELTNAEQCAQLSVNFDGGQCRDCCQRGTTALEKCQDFGLEVIAEACQFCCAHFRPINSEPINGNSPSAPPDRETENTNAPTAQSPKPTHSTTFSPSDKPLLLSTLEPTSSPPTFRPKTLNPTLSPTSSPSTLNPSQSPTSSAITAPPSTRKPSLKPTAKPSQMPTSYPPTKTPTETAVDPTGPLPDNGDITFDPGNLVVSENGLLLSQGLSSRIVARSGQPVKYDTGGSSTEAFHALPDGAATYADPRSVNLGGWIYVSNSEVRRPKRLGGVGAVTFNAQGQVIDYRMLLTGTQSNCAGGRTPWNSWISCEEAVGGRIWEVDPTGSREPRMITLGSPGNGDTGLYESFAFDIRNASEAKFFVTEDFKDGPLRRWTVENPNWSDPWNILHGTGSVEYLVLTPTDSENTTGTYQWTSDQTRGRRSSAEYFRNAEGIDVYDRELFFISKHFKSMFVLDLDSNHYVRQRVKHDLFKGSPDQIVRILGDDGSRMLYFTEDTDIFPAAGVHARNSRGDFFTILEGVDLLNETTGLSFNPDSTNMYVAWQNGTLFEVWRDDGLPFQAETLSVRYHGR